MILRRKTLRLVVLMLLLVPLAGLGWMQWQLLRLDLLAKPETEDDTNKNQVQDF